MDLVNGLDCCGHLCAASGRPADAVTVWAAFTALLRHEGLTDVSADARRRHEPLREARQTLGPARTHAAEERGTAMSTATAAEYALMLTAAGPQPPATAPGPGKLSAREQELVTLVARGRTDAQIAAQLYISVSTVRSHLDRIRDKTGCPAPRRPHPPRPAGRPRLASARTARQPRITGAGTGSRRHRVGICTPSGDPSQEGVIGPLPARARPGQPV